MTYSDEAHGVHRTTDPFVSHSVTPPERPRVSAAVLRHVGQEVLMVKHRRPDGGEYWQLPGGGIQSEELPEDAALRELQEETSLVHMGASSRVVSLSS